MQCDIHSEIMSHKVKKIEVTNVEDPDELRLKRNVLLGYTDVNASGSRALLGIDMRLQYFKMEIPELEGHTPACARHTPPEGLEQDFLPLQILNCKYEEFSIVVVNTKLEGKECHYVANRLMDLCTQSKVESIVLLAVLKLDLHNQAQEQMYENCFYSERKTKLASLPNDTMIQDPFFATFLQMIHVERIPTQALIIPGFKGYKGQASSYDGSKESIELFQTTVNKMTGLNFDTALSNDLVYCGEQDDRSELVAMIYS